MTANNLAIISVNLWQILISLANLLIIFLILKKFLFKPVRNIIATRQAQIDADYAKADEAAKKAQASQEQWEATLATANDQADKILSTARTNAQRRGDAMMGLAKEKADLVLFYPHMGGQFSHKVGAFTQYITEKAIEAGANSVIASHSHVVQKLDWEKGVLCAYSLGNFNMTPDSGVAVIENRTGYGLALHLEIEDKKIQGVSFSIIANIHDGKGISGCPVDELYAQLSPAKAKKLEQDVRYVLQVVCGSVPEGELIRRYYPVTH